MGVHLAVFVFVQAADVAMVEALEQRRQVLADGVVDQVAQTYAIQGVQTGQAFFQVVEHRLIEQRRERGDHRFLDARRALPQGQHGGDAAPGERLQVVDFEMLDQLQQDVRFVFLGQRLVVAVVRFRLAGVGLIVEHHIELAVEVFDRLGECGSGRQRAVDQDDGLAGAGAGVKLGVNLVSSVNIDDSDGWLHVVSPGAN
ncbi:hypothetical protein D3C86_1402000 [compost metagenome]